MLLSRVLISSFVILAAVFFSCTRTAPIYTTGGLTADGKYDSNFPLQPVSEDLERIARSVRLISSFTFYRTYVFNLNDAVTIEQINDPGFSLEKKASGETISQKPGSGSALVIYADRRKVLLLTCLHIVDEPDTAVNYYADYESTKTRFIQTVSIRVRTNISIPSISSVDKIEVIAKDKKKDLALAAVKLSGADPFPEKVFNYRWGRAEELEIGTFVYLLGFPNGKKMLSTAVVSSPSRGDNHNFLVDAALHRGISGGIIVALRDGVPNFELMGIVNAVSAQEANVLRPDPAVNPALMAKNQPYFGDIYVDKQLSVVYGITYAVSIENIRDFIEDNRKLLADNGFNLIIP